MRRILIDYARARNAKKRRGKRVQIELDEAISFTDRKCEELLALDEAMYRLAPLIGRLRDQPVFELSIARRQKMRNAFERPDGKSILDPGDQPERRPRRHLFSGQPQDVGDICER